MIDMENNRHTEDADNVPMHSLREEQVRLTQQRILDTFESELIRHGYADVSIRSVAKRAAISVPTVYRYYPNKQALLSALMEAVTEEEGFDFISILAATREPMETVTKLLDAMWATNEQQPVRTKAIILALAAAGEGEGAELVDTVCRHFAFMASEALAPLSYLPREELRKIEALVALMLSRPVWQRLRYGHDMPLDVAKATVLDSIRASIEVATTNYRKNGKAPKEQSLDRSREALMERFAAAGKSI